MPEDVDQGEPFATEASPLRNGILYNGSSYWRGVVKLEIYWPAPHDYWTKCSGQVVSRQTILTAAHCLTPALPATGGSTFVRAWRPTATGWLDVLPDVWSTVRAHPDYDGSAKNDVGVIIAPTVQPLSNVTSGDTSALAKSTPSGVSMTTLGFGYYTATDFDGQGRSGVLTPTYDGVALDYVFRDVLGNKPSLCRGDSGGPLKSTVSGLAFQYGISSMGSGSGTGMCSYTSHWATTAHNLPWIKSKITGSCLETSTMLSCW